MRWQSLQKLAYSVTLLKTIAYPLPLSLIEFAAPGQLISPKSLSKSSLRLWKNI